MSSSVTRPTVLLMLLLAWAVGLRCWYGSKDLHVHRYWDEKFNVPNVHAVLEEGRLRPVRYAYLRLTYLPQVAVLGGIQQVTRWVHPDFSWFDGETLRPAGFFVSRAVQALLGGLSILLTFQLGRRLFSADVGLLAALFVAANRVHLIHSAMFKPDILVVVTVLLAFLWGLRAIHQPTIWRYLAAGLGVGLAASSKPTAVAVCVPLTLVALALGRSDRRHWLGLPVAGLSAALVFLVLNPYPRYLSAFALQRSRYDAVAARKGTLGDPVETARAIFEALFRGAHGYVIGLFAVAGFVWLLVRLWRRRSDSEVWPGLAMFLAYPLAHIVLYGFVTQNVLPQNLLPVLPFTSLAAAALLAFCWQRAARRLTWLSNRHIVAGASIVLVLLVTFRPNLFAYRIVVPSTTDRVVEALTRELPRRSTKWVWWEQLASFENSRPGEPGPATWRPERLLLQDVPSLADVEPLLLARADATVALLHEHETRQGLPIRASLFRAWGPDLVLSLHPWSPGRTERVTLEPHPRRLLFAIPPGTGVEIAQLRFELPRIDDPGSELLVRVGGRPVPHVSSPLSRDRRQLTTYRFPIRRNGDLRVNITLPTSLRSSPLAVTIERWRSPASGRESGG